VKTIRSNILIKGVISILLPLCIFAITHIFYISRVLTETAQENQLLTTVQLRDNLDLILSEIERSTIHLSNSSLILNILSTPGITDDELNRLRLQSQLDTIFFNFFGSRPEIEYINLSGKGYQFILHTADYIHNYRLGNYNAYLESSNGSDTISQSSLNLQEEKQEYIWVDKIESLSEDFHENYIYLIKRMYDTNDSGERLEVGQLIVGINKNRLADTLLTVHNDMDTDASCISLTDTSTIAIQNKPFIDTLSQESLFKNTVDPNTSESLSEISYKQKSYIVTSYPSTKTAWRVIKIISTKSILRGIRPLILLTVLALALCSFLAISLAVPLANRIVQPLQQLVQHTNKFTETQQLIPKLKGVSPSDKKHRPFFLLSGSFRQILFKYFTLISIIPLIVFSILSYTIYLSSFKQEIRNSKIEEFSQITNSLNLTYYAARQTSERIWTNFDFQQALLDINQNSENSNNPIPTQQEEIIKNIITYEFLQHKYLHYIYVYDSSGNPITGISFPPVSLDTIPDIQHFSDIELANGQFKTLPLDVMGSGTTFIPMGNMVFCILQKSQKIGGHIGYLVFALDVEYFNNTFQYLDKNVLNGISLLQSSGKPIYQTSSLPLSEWSTIRNKLLDLYWKNFLKGNNADTEFEKGVEFNKIDNTMIVQENNDFSIIGQTGYDALLITRYELDIMDAITASMLLNSILIFALTLTGILFFIYRLSFSIAKPLQTLEHAMKTAHKNLGDEDVTIAPSSSNELHALANSFNTMTRRIRALIEDTLSAHSKEKEAELRQKEAEIVSLQSQINPHFLYNTLDTINWLALTQLGRENQISHIVTALSNLFRDNLADSKTKISIEKQLRLVENYLSIQKIRYEERLHITWDIDDAIRPCASIPLLLQPIVENAINHGISKKEQGGHIRISGTKQNRVIRLTVHDDGVGIEPAALAILNSELQTKIERNAMKSIGLHNTNLRIKSIFGDSFGILVESILGAGTTVILTLPEVSIQQNTAEESNNGKV